MADCPSPTNVAHPFEKRCSDETKKADAIESRGFGLNCVGLLVNGSFGRWPNYPLFSHPRTLIFCGELIYLMLHERHIVPILSGDARELLKAQCILSGFPLIRYCSLLFSMHDNIVWGGTEAKAFWLPRDE